MPDPFTIRIFVPDGDPEGVRIIDRMNWTGIGIVFPRSKWSEVRNRSEFARPGVYILVGYRGEEDDLPTVYIGQGDGTKGRIDLHVTQKYFWDRAIAFASQSGGLNRAHIAWLEYALVNRAAQTKQCHLDNGNVPQGPALTEAEKADTQGFLKEILQILPLVGLRVFEFPKPVATPQAKSADTLRPSPAPSQPDTIVVPAQEEGFERVFLGENCWHAIWIAGGMLDKIKYIAAYQSRPVSAITHRTLRRQWQVQGRVLRTREADRLDPVRGRAVRRDAGPKIHQLREVEVRENRVGHPQAGAPLICRFVSALRAPPVSGGKEPT